MLKLRSVSQIAAVVGLFISISAFGIAAEQQKDATPTVDLQKFKKTSETQAANTTPTTTTKNTASIATYKPPLRGAPGGRVGGGTRGPGEALPLIYVLAPDHVGLTVREQPILYWYLSGLTTYPVELTLNDESEAKPLVEQRITALSQPGIQQVSLRDYGVKLETGKRYRWFVTVVVDPDNRSKDVLAGGFIERVDSAAISAMAVGRDNEETVRAYAESGIWYDALSTISQMIEASPNEAMFHEQRASLLEQVGLSEVAQDDRRLASAR